MLVPVFSVIGILSVPLWLHLASTSPTPMTPKEKRYRHDFSAFVAISTRMLQLFVWAHSIAESLSILSYAGIIPASFSGHLLLPEGQVVYLSPCRAVPGLFVILGGILRLRCFREMGAHFTFHVTVLDKHKLITSGPYAYVRHPSYTGSLFIICGLLPWLFLPGSWITQSNIAGSIWFWIAFSPCLTLEVMFVPILLKRCKAEDEILRKQFGREWEKWAKGVPYRLFPGLY